MKQLSNVSLLQIQEFESSRKTTKFKSPLLALLFHLDKPNCYFFKMQSQENIQLSNGQFDAQNKQEEKEEKNEKYSEVQNIQTETQKRNPLESQMEVEIKPTNLNFLQGQVNQQSNLKQQATPKALQKRAQINQDGQIRMVGTKEIFQQNIQLERPQDISDERERSIQKLLNEYNGSYDGHDGYDEDTEENAKEYLNDLLNFQMPKKKQKSKDSQHQQQLPCEQRIQQIGNSEALKNIIKKNQSNPNFQLMKYMMFNDFNQFMNIVWSKLNKQFDLIPGFNEMFHQEKGDNSEILVLIFSSNEQEQIQIKQLLTQYDNNAMSKLAMIGFSQDLDEIYKIFLLNERDIEATIECLINS